MTTPRTLPPFHEMEFSYVRSSGPGGQNVNKVNSKCMLRWDVFSSPSLRPEVRARFLSRFGSRLTQEGVLILTSDRYRDQKRNQEDCLEKLAEMLALVARPPKVRRPSKPTFSSRKKAEKAKKAHSDKKTQRKKGWD